MSPFSFTGSYISIQSAASVPAPRSHRARAESYTNIQHPTGTRGAGLPALQQEVLGGSSVKEEGFLFSPSAPVDLTAGPSEPWWCVQVILQNVGTGGSIGLNRGHSGPCGQRVCGSEACVCVCVCSPVHEPMLLHTRQCPPLRLTDDAIFSFLLLQI